MDRQKFRYFLVIFALFCAWGLGYWMSHALTAVPIKPGTASTTSQARMESLPDDVWLHYKGKLPNTGIGIHRTKDFSVFSGVSVFNTSDSVIYSNFYKESGQIHGLQVRSGGKWLREWSFRQDGTLESETVFDKGGILGAKTYYTVDGKKEREECIRIGG